MARAYMSGSATSPGYVTGINDAADNFSWGAPFTGKTEPWGQEIDGVTQMKPYSALPNNVKDFFNTGFAADNNLGISSGDDKSSFLFRFELIKLRRCISRITATLMINWRKVQR